MEVNDQLNAPSRLTPGERASVAYLIGPQSLHGHGGEEKKKFLLCPCREPNPDRPSRSPVAVLTELSIRCLINYYVMKTYWGVEI